MSQLTRFKQFKQTEIAAVLRFDVTDSVEHNLEQYLPEYVYRRIDLWDAPVYSGLHALRWVTCRLINDKKN